MPVFPRLIRRMHSLEELRFADTSTQPLYQLHCPCPFYRRIVTECLIFEVTESDKSLSRTDVH